MSKADTSDRARLSATTMLDPWSGAASQSQDRRQALLRACHCGMACQCGRIVKRIYLKQLILMQVCNLHLQANKADFQMTALRQSRSVCHRRRGVQLSAMHS